jgi:hypothetical protein
MELKCLFKTNIIFPMFAIYNQSCRTFEHAFVFTSKDDNTLAVRNF